ncbi:helix-turn-helix domain-containing protein [Streptomyces sp. NPDC127110]|uniref:AraC-like ligand-binding domain-containing protein n=1 Tax=Streptomyces sp. NPDC127110 TaxID=3345362 RepID=UPI003632DD50
MWSTVSSSVVPARERFDWFADMVSREVMPTAISSERPAEFRAEAAVLDLGELRVSRLSYTPLRSRRTPALIRRSDPEQYQLGMVSKGAMQLSQGRNHCVAGAGDLVLWDTSRPSDARVPEYAGVSELLILQLPREAVPLDARGAEGMVARRIPGGSGVAAVLGSFLGSLVRHVGRCPDGPDGFSGTSGLGSAAVALAATCLAQQLGADEHLPVEVRAQSLLRRVCAYIEHNLGDPELSPRVIAARHHISVRTLHQLFEGREETVGARIRRRRLERCRDDLARTELWSVPVQVIAARWGFSSPTVFSRSFREAYGCTPREFRAARVALQVKEGRTVRTLRELVGP